MFRYVTLEVMAAGSLLTLTGETATYGGKLMRILKRQADGRWKMHRTMLTIDS